MISFADIYYPLLWIVGFNALATVFLLLVMTKYPKYAIHAFNRVMCLRLGLSIKKAQINPHMTVSYIERGKLQPNQQTLLLVHGFSSSKFSYFGLIKNLPQRYHVIGLDLPGHGGTNLKEKEEYHIRTVVKYVKQFVDHLNLSKQKFHIVGTSLGGHISGVYASLYPEDLSSVSLYCPSGISFNAENMMLAEAKRTGKFVLLPQNDDEFRVMIDHITHRKINIPSIFISGTQQIRSEKNGFYREFLETLILPENIHLLEEQLHKIQVPVLLVWGKEDKVLSVECVDILKQKLPMEPKHIHILDETASAVIEDGGVVVCTCKLFTVEANDVNLHPVSGTISL